MQPILTMVILPSGLVGNALCDELAYDGTHLEMQFFGFENCAYKDGDGVLWAQCNDCLKCVHLHCLDPNLDEFNFKQNLFVHLCQK